jgi:hypothetical protein
MTAADRIPSLPTLPWWQVLGVAPYMSLAFIESVYEDRAKVACLNPEQAPARIADLTQAIAEARRDKARGDAA